jgi:hypothetical protein
MSKPNHQSSAGKAVLTDVLERSDAALPADDNPHEHNLEDSSQDRFFIDENRDVFDRLNPLPGMAYHYLVVPPKPNQVQLRESLLHRRLEGLVEDLVINLRWKFSDYGHPIVLCLFHAIRASALNTVAPSRGIQFRFDGTLWRGKPHLQDTTSLSLFCDDVERLLRDLYGDVDDDKLEDVLSAVRVIVRELTHFVRKELWQEDIDADDFDYYSGNHRPKGLNISSSDCRRALKALEDLRTRARDVSTSPAGHSKYTIQFAELFKKGDKPVPEDVKRARLEKDLHEFELARSRCSEKDFYDVYIAQTREELQRLSNKGGAETDSK